MIKKLLIEFAKWFKSIGILGRQRFWILYWAYKITGWHIRHEEWDFVLKYLPELHDKHEQIVYLLDVGCAKNLFLYEMAYRGYRFTGIDTRLSSYQKGKRFFEHDIRFHSLLPNTYDDNMGYNFITCISVLEHIGNNGRGSFKDQKMALENMCKSLKIGGRLLLTCPSREFAQGHPWHGFTWASLASIMPKEMRNIESTERAGQLCMVLEKVA